MTLGHLHLHLPVVYSKLNRERKQYACCGLKFFLLTRETLNLWVECICNWMWKYISINLTHINLFWKSTKWINMLTMSCDVQNADARADEHSDCGSDIENTSQVVDYRLDANISLTMPTPEHVVRPGYDLRASDDSSCDGDGELSPMPPSKRFKPDPRDEDRAALMFGKGKNSIGFLIHVYLWLNLIVAHMDANRKSISIDSMDKFYKRCLTYWLVLENNPFDKLKCIEFCFLINTPISTSLLNMLSFFVLIVCRVNYHIYIYICYIGTLTSK